MHEHSCRDGVCRHVEPVFASRISTQYSASSQFRPPENERVPAPVAINRQCFSMPFSRCPLRLRTDACDPTFGYVKKIAHRTSASRSGTSPPVRLRNSPFAVEFGYTSTARIAGVPSRPPVCTLSCEIFEKHPVDLRYTVHQSRRTTSSDHNPERAPSTGNRGL